MDAVIHESTSSKVICGHVCPSARLPPICYPYTCWLYFITDVAQCCPVMSGPGSSSGAIGGGTAPRGVARPAQVDVRELMDASRFEKMELGLDYVGKCAGHRLGYAQSVVSEAGSM